MAYQIKLYSLHIPEESGFVIEDMGAYLAPLNQSVAESVNTLKTFRLRLELRVRFAYALEFNEPDNALYNYASIAEPGGGSVYYYFIESMERISNSVALLSLKMDVLNTYFSNPGGNIEALISGSTSVRRRHKDRWTWHNPDSMLMTIVDHHAEGFEPSLRISEKVFFDPPNYDALNAQGKHMSASIKGWKMVYSTSTSGVPVAFFLPYFDENNRQTMYLPVDFPTGSSTTRQYLPYLDYAQIALYDTRLYKSFDLPVLPFISPLKGTGHIVDGVARYSDTAFANLDWLAIGGLTFATETYKPAGMAPNGMTSEDTLYGPVIACYYTPNEDGYSLNMGTRDAFSAQLDYPSTMDVPGFFNTRMEAHPNTLIGQLHKDAPLDPKLKYGEFAYVSLLHDSSEKKFNLDDMVDEGSDSIHSNPSVVMHLSSLWSGQIYYEAQFGSPYDSAEKLNTTDPYYFILQVQRSNEDPLINSEYLTYMMSGYNYDKKSQSLNLTENLTRAGIGVGGAVAALGIGNVFGAIGSAVGAVNSLATAAFGKIKEDVAIEKKQRQAQSAGASVSGLTSQDLFREYNGGSTAPIWVFYEPSEWFKSEVNDYFHYFGYADNTLLANYGGFASFRANELASRHRFNYVELELKWKPGAQSFEEPIANEIKNKFARGVTFIHHNASDDEPWDLDREYENWEASLL